MEFARRCIECKEFIELLEVICSFKTPETKNLIILKNTGAYPGLIIDWVFEMRMQAEAEETGSTTKKPLDVEVGNPAHPWSEC